MGNFIQQARYFIEGLIGRDIELVGPGSLAIIDKKHRIDAWFSHRAQIRSVIEKYKIGIVIDAGANEGQFAQKLRPFYHEDILSFEPVADVFEKLAEAASADPKWHVYKLALGSQEATQTMYVSGHTVFSSLLRANEYCLQRFGQSAKGIREETVRVQRLDSLLASLIPNLENKRIFLKMDTQGYDIEVFKGLGDRLKHVAAIQSEISLIPGYEGMPHWIESMSMYEDAGFGVVGMFPVTLDSGRVIEYDCLMARVDPWRSLLQAQ